LIQWQILFFHLEKLSRVKVQHHW